MTDVTLVLLFPSQWREQTVYILHSHHCLAEARRYGRDLRDCPFSLALDNGIRLSEWVEDATLPVHVEAAPGEEERLVPDRPSPVRVSVAETSSQ